MTTSPPQIVPLDVSELEPPEPLEQILARLREMDAKQVLRVYHRREPFPLYSILEQAGYRHCCCTAGAAYLIYIWRGPGLADRAFCEADARSLTP